MRAAPLEERLVNLESLLMLLQRDVETLNAVVLAQQKELESLRASQREVGDRLSRLAADDLGRDPREERPPHY